MKLILQIACGVILAVVILVVGYTIFERQREAAAAKAEAARIVEEQHRAKCFELINISGPTRKAKDGCRWMYPCIYDSGVNDCSDRDKNLPACEAFAATCEGIK